MKKAAASADFAPASSLAIASPGFDLRQTLESGQVFGWVLQEGSKTMGSRWAGCIGGTPVEVEQRADRLDELKVTPGAEALVARYFALDHPLEAIYATFPADPAMAEALAFCRGVRIIRQPLWECLGTFITSSMKQVKHIAQMSHALRRRFGCRVGDGVEGGFFAYPTPEGLARASEAELRECGLGFRSGNLLRTARMVAEGEADLEAIRAMPDEQALAELCRLPGVGPKIANCVLLFGYERVRAFPIDVWIERVLRHHYFPRKRKVTVPMLQEFSARYFGPYGGYAQQYLFHHARHQPRAIWNQPAAQVSGAGSKSK